MWLPFPQYLLLSLKQAWWHELCSVHRWQEEGHAPSQHPSGLNQSAGRTAWVRFHPKARGTVSYQQLHGGRERKTQWRTKQAGTRPHCSLHNPTQAAAWRAGQTECRELPTLPGSLCSQPHPAAPRKPPMQGRAAVETRTSRITQQMANRHQVSSLY